MNDNINADSYDSDETKKELDFQAILVGNGKNILVVESAPTPLSEILVKQNCKVKKVIPKHDNPLDDVYEKFDVIVLGDFLHCVKSPELVLERLRNALNTGGYLVCSITNIGHAYNRIKLLNGEFEYTKDGLINKNFLRLFTFETILHLVSDANYSITKLYREKKDLDLIHNKGLKYFTIPTELIESIKNDPESLVSKYVFSISPASTDSSKIDYLKEFPKSLTTERLKEFFRYYQGDIAETYDRIIDEKNRVIQELEEKLDGGTSTVKELGKPSPVIEHDNRERITTQKKMIRRLEISAEETTRYTKDRFLVQQETIKGLEESKRINKIMIKGLEQSKQENMGMIKGLEESLRETEQYLKKTVEEYEKTIDEIYSSTTWKIASKFTGGKAKREKN